MRVNVERNYSGLRHSSLSLRHFDPGMWGDGTRWGKDGRLQVLWAEGERVFCRTWREAEDGAGPTVLVVMPASEHPSPACLDSLAHEYGLKDVLDGAWAALPWRRTRRRSSG